MRLDKKDTYKALSAFDLDGTLVKGNCSFLFFKKLTKQQIFSTLDILQVTVWGFLYRAKIVSLPKLHSLVLQRQLKGKEEKTIASQADSFVGEMLLKKLFYHPAIARLQQAALESHAILLISSSPHWLVEAVAKRLQIPYFQGTEYSCNNGMIAGIRHLVDGDFKSFYTKNLAETLGIPKDQIYTYSDSLEDLPFLELSSSAVAVCPSKALKLVAEQRNWEIL